MSSDEPATAAINAAQLQPQARCAGVPLGRASWAFALGALKVQQFDRAVDGRSLFIAGNEKAYRALKAPRAAKRSAAAAAAATPLHIAGGAAPDHAVCDFSEKGSSRHLLASPGGTTSVWPVKTISAFRSQCGRNDWRSSAVGVGERDDFSGEAGVSQQVAQVGEGGAIAGVTERQAIRRRAISRAACGRVCHAGRPSPSPCGGGSGRGVAQDYR